MIRLTRAGSNLAGGWQRDTLFSFAARFGTVGSNYLALALISRIVPVNAFGQVSFVLSVQLTVSLFIELGLGPMLARYASYYLGASEVERAYNVFKAVLVIKLALNSLVVLAAFSLGPFMARVIFGDEWQLALISGVILAAGTSFQSLFIAVFQSLGRFNLVMTVLLVQYGGQLLALVGLWLLKAVTVPSIIGTYGLGFLLLGLVSAYFFPWRQVFAGSVKAERPYLPEYRAFWQWMALGNLALALVVPINTLILAALYPATEVARYYSAFKLAQVFWIMEQVMSLVLLPRLSLRAGLGGDTSVRAYLPRLLALVSGTGLVIALGLFVFAEPIVRSLYGPGYESAVPVLYLLIPMGFGFLLFGAGHQVLISFGRPAASALIVCGAAVLNLLLNRILTPAHGASGAAAAGSITLLCQMGGVWLAVFHK